MNSGITRRLLAYFSITLLLFALVVGMSFSSLFTRNTLESNKQQLYQQAESLAQAFSVYLEGETFAVGNHDQGHGHGNHNNQISNQASNQNTVFFSLVNEFAMGEVWLVDKDTKLITENSQGTAIAASSLPTAGEELIQEALEGNSGYSESFSELLGSNSLSVCVPAYDSTGNVIGAVLVHAPVQNTKESINSGLRILFFSLLSALLMAIVTAVLLSRRFIRPIKAMNIAATKMAEGDYRQQSVIRQSDEIGELAGTLNNLAVKLEAAEQQRQELDKEKQDFYADISHELRTPLTVVRGSLETLRDGKIKDTAKKQEYYSQMISETQYMQNMVNELLELSKLKNISFEVNKEELNISDVLADAVHSMRRISEQKDILINYENNYPLIPAHGDYNRLRQMFTIILDNALKFSAKNSEVFVTVKQNSDKYEISISDFGVGIAKEDLVHIFDRFYKDDSQRNQSGTGIGLAIAYQISLIHDIEINVESEPGKGTTFCFMVKARDI